MRLAVYPGTFDPVTNGHLDITARACKLFDRVIMAVAAENYKQNLIGLEERVAIVRRACSPWANVDVVPFDGLLMNFAVQQGAVAIVRGLRAVSDFEYEFQLAMMNKKLSQQVETVFLMTSNEYAFLSSSMIRQVASLGGCISGLVPVEVENLLKQRFGYQQQNEE